MRLVTLPGVFRPISDTWLLADALDGEDLPAGARVLDLCSGSGALAIRAARRAEVTAVDVSRRAVATIRLNALLNGVARARGSRRPVRRGAGRAVRRDRLQPAVRPGAGRAPARGPARAWDGGRDGRALLDRICEQAPDHLRPGGVLLVVHSSLLGYERTAELLAAGGLEVDLAAQERGPLGPLMNGRRAHLEAEGLLAAGQDEEDVLVVRGRKPPCVC